MLKGTKTLINTIKITENIPN